MRRAGWASPTPRRSARDHPFGRDQNPNFSKFQSIDASASSRPGRPVEVREFVREIGSAAMSSISRWRSGLVGTARTLPYRTRPSRAAGSFSGPDYAVNRMFGSLQIRPRPDLKLAPNIKQHRRAPRTHQVTIGRASAPTLLRCGLDDRDRANVNSWPMPTASSRCTNWCAFLSVQQGPGNVLSRGRIQTGS